MNAQFKQITETGYAAFADRVHEFEAKGGVCQLVVKTFRLPDGNMAIAYQYETEEIQHLRAALAEVIAQIRKSDHGVQK